MIVGYLYDNLPLPRELVRIILEYYGVDDINSHIKKIIPLMLNSNHIIKFDLIRLFQIKLPPTILLSSETENYHKAPIGLPSLMASHCDTVNRYGYFNYNNDKFCFSTPWINIFSKYPFANPHVNLNNSHTFTLPIGLNKLGNCDSDDNFIGYDKLDCDENNLLLNFLNKFENWIFIQICKCMYIK